MKKLNCFWILRLAKLILKVMCQKESEQMPFAWKVNVSWYRHRHPESVSMSDEEILVILKTGESK